MRDDVAHLIASDTARVGRGIELTEAGATHFADVYAHARTTTDAAFDGIDPAMLDTALTVLLAVNDRATAQLG